MKALAELLISVLELLELEGAILRRQILRLGVGAVFLVLCAFLAMVGFGFLVWSLYLYSSLALGPPGGALVTGLAVTLAAGVLLWAAKAQVR